MATAHALMGPSSADRWLNCPGSVAANDGAPYEESVHSLAGTSAHALLELCLRTQLNPALFIGQTLIQGHHEIDAEMIHAVGIAVTWVAEYERAHPGCVVRIESPVYPFGPDSPVWGTPDVQIEDGTRELVTLDFKYGTTAVKPVRDNPQLKIYHLGGMMGRKFARYRSVIVSPRVPKRKPVQEHVHTTADLLNWAQTRVIPVIPIALNYKKAPRVAGDWCHFCAANRKCPAQQDRKQISASQEFQASPIQERLI